MLGLLQKLGGNSDQETSILTKEEVERRRKQAAALIAQGSDTSPVQHWSQGAARMMQALNGAITEYQADKADRDANKAGESLAASLMGGMQKPDATPAPALAPRPLTPSAAPAQNNAGDFIPGVDDRYDHPTALKQLALWGDGLRPDALSGLAPQKAIRLAAMLEDNPHEASIGITSGYRSPETQAQLYASRANNPYPVAPPGKSRHNHGEAADLSFDDPRAQEWSHSNAAKYGLAFPHANDPIHVEVAKGSAPVQVASAGGSGDYLVKQQQAADGSASPVAQVAQAGNTPSLSQLMAIRNNRAFERLPAGSRAVVNALIQKSITQETKDPRDGVLKDLSIEEKRRALSENQMETQVIGGNLYERKKGTGNKWTLAVQKAADSGETKRSLVPIYGTNDAGETVLLQPDDAGNANQMKLPPGVRVASGVEKIDTGTEFVLMDRKTGAILGKQPKDVRGREAQEAIGASEGKVAAAAPQAVANADRVLNDIAAVEKHPNLNEAVFGGALGLPGKLNRNVPGSEAYGLGRRIEQLKGQTFMSAYDQLRGGGAITDTEGAKATDALARLDAAQSEKDFRGALADLRDVLRTGADRARKMGLKFGTIPTDAPAPAAQGNPQDQGWKDMGGGVRIREKR